MKANWFVRGTVLVFAVLLGGGYVYSQANGIWPQYKPAQEPATVTVTNTPTDNKEQFLHGSKSAIFVELPASPESVESTATPNNAGEAKPLPGPKSLVMAEPETPKGDQAPPPAPPTKPQLLPGSKSATVVDLMKPGTPDKPTSNDSRKLPKSKKGPR